MTNLLCKFIAWPYVGYYLLAETGYYLRFYSTSKNAPEELILPNCCMKIARNFVHAFEVCQCMMSLGSRHYVCFGKFCPSIEQVEIGSRSSLAPIKVLVYLRMCRSHLIIGYWFQNQNVSCLSQYDSKCIYDTPYENIHGLLQLWHPPKNSKSKIHILSVYGTKRPQCTIVRKERK